MKVSVMWWGGRNYSHPTIDDIEHFNSLKEAKEVFLNRYNNTDFSTPYVSDNCNMCVAVGTVDYMELPDYIISLGPRGGMIIDKWRP